MFYQIRDISAFITLIMFACLVAFLGDWAVISGF
jgi:hypothetical protein